jgi:glucosamine--fructose-6-phosphate aminotransferase (isomerizing)
MTLISEIHEQANVLEQLLKEQLGRANEIAQAMRDQPPNFIFLAARGTSDNAGRYANYVWGSFNQLPVALATPSLFSIYQRPPNLKGAWVVGVSQSGQSPDIVAVLEEGRRQGCRTLAITNAPASPLAEAADLVLDIQAGVEKAVAATKTYSAELMAIAMLSACLEGDEERIQSLQQVPGWIHQVMQEEEKIARLAERYRYMEQCVVLGRGYNYATAFEWSLKLKELSYIAAEPYSPADFLHGPIAVVEAGFPVLAVAPSGKLYENIAGLLKQLRGEKRAELVVITDQEELAALAQSVMRLPRGISEWLSPLVGIVAAQMFACYLTKVKGFNTEAPRSIRKITETQ